MNITLGLIEYCIRMQTVLVGYCCSIIQSLWYTGVLARIGSTYSRVIGGRLCVWQSSIASNVLGYLASLEFGENDCYTSLLVRASLRSGSHMILDSEGGQQQTYSFYNTILEINDLWFVYNLIIILYFLFTLFIWKIQALGKNISLWNMSLFFCAYKGENWDSSGAKRPPTKNNNVNLGLG